MNITENKKDRRILEIDFDLLMDLRIDYAFKLLFSKGDPRILISLLNAIFANKKIKRVIKSLAIKNPYLDKESDEIMFAKWLSVITQKEITNKAIIENVYKDEEEIQMAISALARHGEDKITRQAYQRRQDEIYFFNKQQRDLEEAKAEIERLRKENEELRARKAT